MEPIKHQRSQSFNSNKNKKIKGKRECNSCFIVTTVETDRLLGETITILEDLSNEIIYEIFEFLDYFHVYEAFFKVNRRFRNLITNSTLPIKINLSSISKTDLHRYYKDIIIRNKYQINSLRVSNLFIYHDPAFPLFDRISIFRRLETIVLQNIESYYLEDLLHQFTRLPLLSSLIIRTIFDNVTNGNAIYPQIFGLPALKYCNLSLQISAGIEPLPIATNEYSSITHLVIKNIVYLRQLNGLLSYVPHLRRLSLHSVSVYNSSYEQTKICPTVLNHLTHVSLKLDSITFDQFDQLIINLFSSIQVLHISADERCMNATRWERLILSHLPNLRIFDILLNIHTTNDDSRLRTEDQINQFTSPFWIERQWFFEHRYYLPSYENYRVFYSTNPYRRKHYTLRAQKNKTTCSNDYETVLKSVANVCIQSEKEMVTSMCYFLNATELTVKCSFTNTHSSIAKILSRIIPLKQLTNLVIEPYCLSLINMIELLQFTPNIHTLIFDSMHFDNYDDLSIQQNETFRLVSSTNTITNVTLEEKCSLNRLKMLVALCPRIQHLTIHVFLEDMKSITQFLLEKPNENVCHLVSLCFSDACTDYSRNLEALITSRTLVGDYMLKLVGSKLCLWW